MNNDKPVQFQASAGSYFVVAIVVAVMSYIPWLGWAFAFNFMSEWAADNAKVNGKEVSYTAGYGETLKFIFINSLLIIITLGIYTFWFVPKMYKYFADHIAYGSSVPATEAAPAETAEAPAAPAVQ